MGIIIHVAQRLRFAGGDHVARVPPRAVREGRARRICTRDRTLSRETRPPRVSAAVSAPTDPFIARHPGENHSRATDQISSHPASRTAQLAVPAIAIPAAWRSMGASAGLDKGEVTDRVINVVKNFNKVDPAKVRRPPAQTERLP